MDGERVFMGLTGEIIECGRAVYAALGGGYAKTVYKRALAREMEHRGLHFMCDKTLPVTYRGKRIGARRVHFLVEDSVLVVLETGPEQTYFYTEWDVRHLDAFQVHAGILFNFGVGNLGFKRIAKLDKYYCCIL